MCCLKKLRRTLANDHTGSHGIAGCDAWHYGSIDDAKVVDGSAGRTIPCSTLDTLLAGSSHGPRLIKIDVEGHELAVLRGAVQTLERWQPSLLIETLKDYTSGEQVTSFLTPYGYQPYRCEHNTFEPIHDNRYAQDTFYFVS